MLTTHVRTVDRVLMVPVTTRVTAQQDIRAITARLVRLLLSFYVTLLWHSGLLYLYAKKVATGFMEKLNKRE